MSKIYQKQLVNANDRSAALVAVLGRCCRDIARRLYPNDGAKSRLEIVEMSHVLTLLASLAAFGRIGKDVGTLWVRGLKKPRLLPSGSSRPQYGRPGAGRDYVQHVQPKKG